jgi:hypothetical protein
LFCIDRIGSQIKFIGITGDHETLRELLRFAMRLVVKQGSGDFGLFADSITVQIADRSVK